MLEYKKLEELIQIHSPSGYTREADKYTFDLLTSFGHSPEFTRKGSVRCSLGPSPKIAIAAHVDTLGGIIAEVKSDGTLRIDNIGGMCGSLFEGEYVQVFTVSGKAYSGTFLFNNPSLHANRDSVHGKRELKNMHIRLDEEVSSKQNTLDLGIQVGDFVCFDTRYQETSSGYIKSRFLDNKAGCFVLFEIARRAKEIGKELPIELLFTNYEEVGHGGAAGYSDTIEELIVVDMGVVGDSCQGSEKACSICAKDSTGPYDYEMRKKLMELAISHEIPYRVDIYPHYGSDGSIALAAGHDFRVALVGPGVAASHGVERTHKKGIEATIELCWAYINEAEQN